MFAMTSDRELPVYQEPADGCSCPACSSASARQLRRCTGCDWTDVTGAREARRRLSRFHGGAGERAYLVGGCQVCSTCATQFSKHPMLCPLRVFYVGLGLWSLSRAVAHHTHGVARLHRFLHACLRERGYPEEVEGYWHRMFAWLETEAHQSTWPGM